MPFPFFGPEMQPIREGQTGGSFMAGSGWTLYEVAGGYVNIAPYVPYAGNTYIPFPKDLAAKKAVVNVKNADNECLKWALKSAFPSGESFGQAQPLSPKRRPELGRDRFSCKIKSRK